MQHFMNVTFWIAGGKPTPPPVGVDVEIEAKRVRAGVTIRPLNGIVWLRCHCENYTALGQEACPTTANQWLARHLGSSSRPVRAY